MELQFIQRDWEYLRSNVRQVQNLEQTQEVRLPEGMPDIGRVLCAWGQGTVRSKEWRNEGMTVTGTVQVWALYAPEDGSEPRSMEAELPFTGKWSFPDSKREGVMIVSAAVCHVDARALSSRKMMVRATVGIQAQALEMAQAAVFSPGNLPENVEILQRTYPAVLPREAGEKQFLVDEDLQLDGIPRKILACQVQPVVTEQAAAGGRVVFRGDCRVHCLYMDEEDQLRSADVVLPFAQLSELDRDYDKDATAQVTMAVTNVDAQLMEGTLHLQCGLVGQYVIYERCMLEVTEDAYSPFMPVEPRMDLLALPMLLEQRQEKVELTTEWETAASRVVDVCGVTMQPTVYREGDTAIIEVPGSVQVLYYDEEGNLRCDSRNWGGRAELMAGENSTVLADLIAMQQPTALIMGEKLRCDSNVTWMMTTTARQEIPMVTGLAVGEREIMDPARPSLILQRMGEKGLWEIAKACGSTVEAIERANGLQGEPQVGQMLLIPVM